MDDLLTIVVPAYNERTSLEANLPVWLRALRGPRLAADRRGRRLEPTARSRCCAAWPRIPGCRLTDTGRTAATETRSKTGLFRTETPYAVTMDADGQHQLEDVGRLLEAMQTQDADLVIGARVVNDTSGAYRRLGKGLIRLLARMLFPVRIRDLNSGFKLYRTEIVQRLLPLCPGSMAFSDVVTLLHLNLDLHVVEVPVETRPRQGGRSTINTMTAVDTLLEIVNVLMWFKPLKIFLPLAFLLVLAGVAWAVPFLLAGTGMSAASLLAILSGMIVGMLGFLAEQLAYLRRVELPDLGARRVTPG